MPRFLSAVYYGQGDSVIDTSTMLLTVSSFGESHRRVNPAVAFNYLSFAKYLQRNASHTRFPADPLLQEELLHIRQAENERGSVITLPRSFSTQTRKGSE